MVDKDLQNLDLIHERYTNAQVLLCVFHVIKYIKVRISNVPVPTFVKNELRTKFINMIYCESEEDYNALYDQIKKIDASFGQYFTDNWHNCKPLWMFMYRKQNPTFGTTTNNIVESFNANIKRIIQHDQHISETVKELICKVGDFIRRENATYLKNFKTPTSAFHQDLLKALNDFVSPYGIVYFDGLISIRCIW
jgi:hypothetical protein